MTSTRRHTRLVGTREKLGLSKACPPGEILRAPYTRKFSNSTKQSGYNVKRGNKTYRIYPKVSSVLVKASCMKNKGLPGKGPKKIGPLKEGELTRYGYNVHNTTEKRKVSLRKAIAVYGVTSVIRKLVAVANLTKRTAPEAHRIFVKDYRWIEKEYTLKKNYTTKKNRK
jgi:hypothetical protein